MAILSRLGELRMSMSPVLSAKVLGYSPGGLIGHKLLSPVPCGEGGARLPIYSPSSLRVMDDLRALRAQAKRVDFSITYTDVTMDEHTVNVPIDWREARAGDTMGWDVAARAARTAKRFVATQREYNIAQYLMNTSNYASGYSETVGGTTNKWDSITSKVSDQDPITLIKIKAAKVRAACGQRPTKFWCGAYVWDMLQNNTNVMAAMKLAPPSAIAPVWVTPEAFAAAIGVEKVEIGSGVYSSDGTTIGGDIWSDAAGLVVFNEDVTSVEAPTYGLLAQEKFGTLGETDLFGFVSTEVTEGGKLTSTYYTEMYKPWVAMNFAGYLWLDTLGVI